MNIRENITLSENQHRVVDRILNEDSPLMYIGWPRFHGATIALCVAAMRLEKTVLMVSPNERLSELCKRLCHKLGLPKDDKRITFVSAGSRGVSGADIIMTDAIPQKLYFQSIIPLLQMRDGRCVVSYAASDCPAYGFTADPAQTPGVIPEWATSIVLENTDKERLTNLKTLYAIAPEKAMKATDFPLYSFSSMMILETVS